MVRAIPARLPWPPGQARERRRQRRLTRLAVVLGATLAVWWRVVSGGSLNPLDGLRRGPEAMLWLPALLIVLLIAVVMLLPMLGQGRSPHLTYRPAQIDVDLRDEVTKTLNLFLGYATFKDRLGGTRGGASCSRASRAPARPTWPRPWPATPGCRSCSYRRRASSRCGTA